MIKFTKFGLVLQLQQLVILYFTLLWYGPPDRIHDKRYTLQSAADTERREAKSEPMRLMELRETEGSGDGAGRQKP